MMNKIWTIMKRHHQKGIFTCAVVGAGFLLAKYGLSKIQERRQNNLLEYFEHFRRGKHYENTQLTCNQTVLSLINNLRTSIVNLLDSDELRNMLKTNPKNKIELWEELKIIAFARATIAAYGNAILVLLLRVQFNIIGGYMYLSTKNIDDKSMMGSSELQEKFLQCVEHFISSGIGHFVDLMKPIVASVVGSISLKEKLKLANVDEILAAIKEGFEKDTKVPLRNLSEYAIPVNNVNLMPDSMREDLIRLFNETRDVLDSDEFLDVLEHAVGIGFANLSDLVTDFFLDSGGLEGEFVNPHESGAPLAKLIPAMNNFVFLQCSTKPKHVVEILLQDEMIKLFGANVYDAFSQPSLKL